MEAENEEYQKQEKIFICDCGEIFITKTYHKLNCFCEERSECPSCHKYATNQAKNILAKEWPKYRRKAKKNDK